jgi:hypothetical protein
VFSGFLKRSCSIKNLERDGDLTKSHRALDGWSETMAGERQKGDRVTFERGIPAHMMGIDGTWRRDCRMEDVSETGAKLTVEGSVEGLHLKEFFLLLSSTGLAYRRCELSWVNGDQIGVNFLKQGDKKKKAAARRAAQEA